MNVALTVLSVVVLACPFFFWGRGIIKSRRDDIILGFCILIFVCVAGLLLSPVMTIKVALEGVIPFLLSGEAAAVRHSLPRRRGSY